MAAERLFKFFVGWLFVILMLFGLCTTAVIIWGGDGLALRMVNVFAAMFSAIVGLGTGYLLGVRNVTPKGDTDDNSSST